MSDIRIKSIVMPYRSEAAGEFGDIAKAAKSKGIKLFFITEENSIRTGEIHIECINPEKEDRSVDKNEGSIVLIVSFKEFDMLLTGDIGKITEKRIYDRYSGKKELPTIEVLKCAHHGSKNSNSEEFLNFLKPMMAIISCSADNRYGHPHREVLERLNKIRAMTYVTKDKGELIITTDGTKIRVKSFIP